MDVIKGNRVEFPSFTSRGYVPSKNGVVVSTRVPINLFDYNIPGSSITIIGRAVVQFVGSGRKLRDEIGGTDAKINENEEASFELKVDFQDEIFLKDEVSTMNNSGSLVGSKCFAIIVMVFASTYSMWWIFFQIKYSLWI